MRHWKYLLKCQIMNEWTKWRIYVLYYNLIKNGLQKMIKRKKLQMNDRYSWLWYIKKNLRSPCLDDVWIFDLISVSSTFSQGLNAVTLPLIVENLVRTPVVGVRTSLFRKWMSFVGISLPPSLKQVKQSSIIIIIIIVIVIIIIIIIVVVVVVVVIIIIIIIVAYCEYSIVEAF